MERNADAKETIESLGDDLRERVTRAAEPVTEGVKEFWGSVAVWTKKNPGTALSLAAAGGALAGILFTRMASPLQSNAEQKARHWVHNAQDGWEELQEGLGQALASVRSAIGRFK